MAYKNPRFLIEQRVQYIGRKSGTGKNNNNKKNNIGLGKGKIKKKKTGSQGVHNSGKRLEHLPLRTKTTGTERREHRD